MYWPDTGQFQPFRCGAPNLCPYCAWRTAVENVAIVGIDARENSAPTVGMTLTTHRADFDRCRFTRAVAELIGRFLRPLAGVPIEYLGNVEWSTGSGGRGRMLHMHVLLKGFPLELLSDCGEHRYRRQRCGRCMECQLSLRWEKITGGAWKVDLRELRSAGGAVAYMVGHHHKQSQSPPAGLRGIKRHRPSRGYYSRPVGELREQARRVTAASAQNRQLLDRLAGFDASPEARDDLLAVLLEREQARPAPVPVRLLGHGRQVMDLRTGELLK